MCVIAYESETRRRSRSSGSRRERRSGSACPITSIRSSLWRRGSCSLIERTRRDAQQAFGRYSAALRAGCCQQRANRAVRHGGLPQRHPSEKDTPGRTPPPKRSWRHLPANCCERVSEASSLICRIARRNGKSSKMRPAPAAGGRAGIRVGGGRAFVSPWPHPCRGRRR